MPDCIECGEYTKFKNGLCTDCYQKENGNKWVAGVIKGRIAETIIEQLFISLDFQVYKYGMENTIPGIADLLKGVRGDVSKNIRQMPDFVVFKDKQAHFIEVKYRKSGKLSIKDIENYGDYPFENALFVLVTPKHIKCISYSELKEGKEITEKCRNWLGSRKEFETCKDTIMEYCKYAVKFFENVD
ncbi:hypothetical protein PY092_01695 [Muricauda sp. 334s03]|uniref:Uncharacterized protein n=1 Tax=Flagellimonas yonaguniensis TaxID=3031325 RepID=A0ABT5XUS8_9FLAO|nr:hypothetical protein [[Muricauda] yonaguniensis]MDF0714846.1 hypothetical protein [[Muricauda] yonaguniensis]